MIAAVLAGCPEQDDVSTSTSATESSATMGDPDGDPSTSSPSTSTTDPEEPTSTSTTTADSDPTTTGGPPDTVTGSPTDATTSENTSSSTTEFTATAGSTTSDEPECGNGMLDPGEECDKGDKNADGDYGGCNLDCTQQPFCGDGETQSELGEDCDLSDEELVEAAICTDVCTWSGVIAFVTSESYTGDLGGTDAADEECVLLATAAGLVHPDGYRAWISVGSDNPSAGIPKVNDAYYRLDGKKIAANSQELFGGKLKNPLNITETMEQIGTSKVWTNTTPTGLTASDDADCQSFSSLDGKQTGIVGRTDQTDAGWTQHPVQASCLHACRLYCFSNAF